MGRQRWTTNLIVAGSLTVVLVLGLGSRDLIQNFFGAIVISVVILSPPLILFHLWEDPRKPKRNWTPRPTTPLTLEIAAEQEEALSRSTRQPGRLPSWFWLALLWTSAAIYLVVIVLRASGLLIGGRGMIVGCILGVFAPMPILFLVYRHRPDRKRAHSRFRRARARLARRVAGPE